jgi:hypothetical protein
MFILIPIVIIFLASAYIYANDDISIYLEIFIYIFIAFIAFASLYITKFIKNDLKQQEKNITILEINKLKIQLKNTKDEKIQQSILHKIFSLEKLI